MTFEQKIPPIASTHKQTWVKTELTTVKIDANLHCVPFQEPPAVVYWNVVLEYFLISARGSNTEALNPFFFQLTQREHTARLS